jgi:hypothetical protein
MRSRSIKSVSGKLNVVTKNRVSIKASLSTFYALNELRVYIYQDKSCRHSVERLRQDFDFLYKNYTSNLALMLRDYLILSCFSEARHSRTMATKTLSPTIPEASRSLAWQYVVNYDPISSVPKLLDVFGAIWAYGFGGRAWKKIAKTIQMYGTVDDTVFIDYVVDLTHNGGCALNKGALIEMNCEVEKLLSYKKDYSLLFSKPEYYDSEIHSKALHPEVTFLITRAKNLGLLPEDPTLALHPYCSSPRFNLKTVAWGKIPATLKVMDNTAGLENYDPDDYFCPECELLRSYCNCQEDWDDYHDDSY